MCLSKIKRVIKNPTQKQYAAWKLFDVYDDTGNNREALHFTHQALKGTYVVPLNRWIKADSHQVLIHSLSVRYDSGFHAYLTKKDAEVAQDYLGIYTILRVAVRGVRIIGEQDNQRVLVADEMYVKRNGVLRMPSV